MTASDWPAGFAIFAGPITTLSPPELAIAYDSAIANASPADIKIGSTNTRVSDFVNRGPAFDDIYLYPPLLTACDEIIQQPFKLSTLHARTIHPYSPAQRLHVDFAADGQGWPMVGFILMIDDFTPENGATVFLPASQGLVAPPNDRSLVPACGLAGSLLVFNGSIWHGHGPNRTDKPRRSIQGAYIRRSESSPANLPARMLPETLNRVSPFAKHLLALPDAPTNSKCSRPDL